MREDKRCHDCHANEGEFHVPGCDAEVCPFCREQLIGCNCAYHHLGLWDDDAALPIEEVYENGLNETQAAEWDRILKAKGLIPYRWSPMLVDAALGQ